MEALGLLNAVKPEQLVAKQLRNYQRRRFFLLVNLGSMRKARTYLEEICQEKGGFYHFSLHILAFRSGDLKNSFLEIQAAEDSDDLKDDPCLVVLSDKGSVVAALDDLERQCGEAFGQIFKTITVDNGSEFSDAVGIARSALAPEGVRTQVFFCHAYCSWERGSNENQNTMIRRRYPKGFDFADTTEEEIKGLERWINKYPRGIFNYKSAAKMFQQEFGDLISLLA